MSDTEIIATSEAETSRPRNVLRSDFYVTVLGSGAALPTSSRHCSAQVVSLRGFKMLIDCAEGTQEQLRQYHIKMQSLKLICISHLHGDHFYGLPGLLATMNLMGRDKPLTIVGPKGIAEALGTLHRLSNSHFLYDLQFRELTDDMDETGETTAYENDYCRIKAFMLQHSVATFGYRIEEKPKNDLSPRSYAYCSDTAYFESLAEHAKEANLLCIESTFASDLAEIAREKLHCTALQAATIAKDAAAKKLLLTHFSNRYKNPDVMLEEAKTVFADTDIAYDGEQYSITR